MMLKKICFMLIATLSIIFSTWAMEQEPTATKSHFSIEDLCNHLSLQTFIAQTAGTFCSLKITDHEPVPDSVIAHDLLKTLFDSLMALYEEDSIALATYLTAKCSTQELLPEDIENLTVSMHINTKKWLDLLTPYFNVIFNTLSNHEALIEAYQNIQKILLHRYSKKFFQINLRTIKIKEEIAIFRYRYFQDQLNWFKGLICHTIAYGSIDRVLSLDMNLTILLCDEQRWLTLSISHYLQGMIHFKTRVMGEQYKRQAEAECSYIKKHFESKQRTRLTTAQKIKDLQTIKDAPEEAIIEALNSYRIAFNDLYELLCLKIIDSHEPM